MDNKYLNDEFNRFFEFPTEDKSQVSSVSAKLFAEHIAYPVLMDNARMTTEADQLHATIKQQQARIAELEKDAKRYQYLRKHRYKAKYPDSIVDYAQHLSFTVSGVWQDNADPRVLDSMIDQAIAALEQKESGE